MHELKLWVRTSAIIFAIAPWPLQAIAETWPQHPVRMIVPIAAGSSPDVAARVFADRLKSRWGQPVIVENRPGADGLIGTAAFAAAQDDHTLLFSFAAPLTVYPATHDKLSYDPTHDIVPISMAAETFGTITVPASLHPRTLSEFVDWARARPGKVNWTSGGGAFPFLFASFVKSAGLDMTEVPYRDQNLAVQDTAEGRIQVIVTPITAVLPLVQGGKLRVLAVTNRTRGCRLLYYGRSRGRRGSGGTSRMGCGGRRGAAGLRCDASATGQCRRGDVVARTWGGREWRFASLLGWHGLEGVEPDDLGDR